MNKLSKILVACAAMAAVASPAYAIQADFTGFLQSRGFAYDNMDGNDDTDDNARGVDTRFRLWTNTALNENVKAVFGFEVDYVWGDSGVGKVGADQKGEIEIKHLYLDFNIPNANTNVKVGTQYFKHGGGFIVGDDATGLQARYTPSKDHSFLFSWIKSVENDVNDDSLDADYYQIQYDGSFAGWKVSPFVGYLDGTPTRSSGALPATFSKDFTAWYVGLETSGKVGPVGLSAAAVANFWDNDQDVAGTNVDDGMGLALWAKATYAMGPTSFLLEAGYYGDDEAGQFLGVAGYNNFSEIVTGGRFDRRSGMGGDQTVAGTGNKSYYMNFLYAKLGAEHKFNDAQKVSAYYIYSKEAQDTFDRDDITFGHEIDAYYDHAITKGLTWSVGGGYLLADDDFGAGDDAWKVGTALTYTF